FVGHPLAELPTPGVSRETYAAENNLDPEKYWITLMPGSRRKEVRMNLPTMLEAATLLWNEHEFLLPVAPALDRGILEAMIPEMKGSSALPGSDRVGAHVGRRVSPPRITLVSESLPALWHSRAGIIASGTATVEAAMMSTPFVMVYRVSPLTYALGRHRIKVPHFAMVNLIADRRIVPELVQQDFTVANILKHLEELLPDGKPRWTMLEGLSGVKEKLRMPAGSKDRVHPADCATELILALVGDR